MKKRIAFLAAFIVSSAFGTDAGLAGVYSVVGQSSFIRRITLLNQ